MFRTALTRIVAAGAALTLAALVLAAIAARTSIHSLLFRDLDDELQTLSTAIASDLELRGTAEVPHEALRAGMEANTFVYRLEHHAAVLFDGRGIIAATGDLARHARLSDLRTLARHDERPFSAREPFTGQHRLCRFRVVRLGGAASGATLLIFRSIETISRTLGVVDAALALVTLAGFAATVVILTFAVRRALQPVEEMTEQLQRSFDAQRRLVADAAHELKTPAAVIAAEAQELARGRLAPDEAREAEETIARAAEGLAREVDDLLELARGDAGAPRERETFPVDDAVDEAIAFAGAVAREHGVLIDREERGECLVHGDRGGITRALANLILNAVRYSPEGSRVRVATRATSQACEIDVGDRGPGIPAGERARIFERFVRLPAARRKHPEGAGLGLAIVDQVVRAHGGSVDVLDREGGGTVFRVRLSPSSEERS